MDTKLDKEAEWVVSRKVHCILMSIYFFRDYEKHKDLPLSSRSLYIYIFFLLRKIHHHGMATDR